MEKKQKIVIIGGVACGPKAGARIKRLNPEAEVTLLEKGDLLSYAGCGLPFYISGEVEHSDELMATPTGVVRDVGFFKNVKDIDVKSHTLVERVDREKKAVHAKDLLTGEAVSFNYDKLVLAVGGNTVKLPVEGVDLNGVHFLHTVEQAKKIRDESGPLKGKNAVIIGAGLIGVETMEAFRAQGMNVTVIEMLTCTLGAMLDPEICYHLHKEIAANGVNLKTSEALKKITGDDNGNVKSVVTDKGEYPADMVLMAVGVRPNVELAKAAGLEIGVTGAIKTDTHMRTSDPDIYAGGDCVESTSLVTGKPTFAPLGSTANKHGRIIADNICGVETEFKGITNTAICKIFNINAARVGLTEKMAREQGYDVVTILSPSPDKAHFMKDAKLIVIKLVVDRKTEKLLGAQIVGPGDVAKRIEILVANITGNGKVTDIGHYDLAYAPPFSSAMDNIITAANIAENKLRGITRSYTPVEVKAKIDKGDDFIFLDVRSPQEYEQMRIEDSRVKLIPLGKLRSSLDELPKDKEIIAFCKISLRGYEAERILTGLGYENVKFMDGGVVCWPYEKVVNM